MDGGKVLLSPKVDKNTLPTSVKGCFTTAFWSSIFLSEEQPGTMGLFINHENPAFSQFTTDYYTDYQWWPMCRLGRPMVIDALIKDNQKIEPIIKVIDGFLSNRNMAMLFEAKVGEGKLKVSSMGLNELENEYIEAKNLKHSILNYMNIYKFNPKFEVSIDDINLLVSSDKKSN